MGACGVELTAAELEVGTQAQRHVWVVGGHRAKRVGAGLIGSVPFADREQGLDPVRSQDGVVRPVGTHRGEPRLSGLGGLSWPSEHRQHVGERDVGLLQCKRVANLLGDLEGLVELRETLRRRDRDRQGCCRACVSTRTSTSFAPTMRASSSACSQTAQ